VTGPLLAFDCSGGACSAAVWRDGGVRAERFAEMERGHAETLLPQIEAVMAEAGADFPELAAIATTVGPGSFTGLRIGLAAARALALASGRPIVALTAFEAFFAGIDDSTGYARIVVAIDSRRGPVFAQVFESGGQAASIPELVEADAVAAFLPAGPVLVTGDGTGPFRGLDRPGLEIRPARIRAAAFARAALDADAAIRTRPALPLYLRAPDVTLPGSRVP
jgi:tRNA threonylcarbamoyladenosine biosynthesis protein TsaB